MGDLSLDDMMASEARTSEKLGQMIAPETSMSATVMKIDRENVFFALGSRNEGIAGMRQFREPPSVGQTFDVIVQKFDAEEGLYEVTVPGGSVQVDDWGDIADGMVVEARVTGSNTGVFTANSGAIYLSANNNTSIGSLAGAVALALGGGSGNNLQLGIAGAVGIDLMSGTTDAFIDGPTSITADGVTMDATRTGYIVSLTAGVSGAVGRQGIQMRRADAGMAEGREALAAPLVGGDEQHLVRRVVGHGAAYPVLMALR